MADEVTPIRKAIDPYTDGSGGWTAPVLNYGLSFKDYGSYGLRQYGGWVREEFLPQLAGRAALSVYREMLDNSSTVGSMIFAITQAMRKVEWRLEPANDSSAAQQEVDFVASCQKDMSHTWEDFITEALSMLGYGFSVHEVVYKRRLGLQPTISTSTSEAPSSLYNDGLIGWRRLPIRGQETVLKWFFDTNGQIQGVTQQPYVGTLIDIPIQKMLLFRPTQHKNNPEGRSILRTAYRSYYFVKRLEELEAILFERMSGFPVMYVPSALIEKASGPTPDSQAAQALQAYKKLVTNLRISEQMGALLPSDTYKDAEGKPSSVRMFDLQLLTPSSSGGGSGSKGGQSMDKTIARHKVDMLMTLLCDFIQMGHEIRGTNNLGTMKVDMFYGAIEGWLSNITEVMNRYALPRLWQMNNKNPSLQPMLRPDLPQRMDLDGLGSFVNQLALAGMPLFPDEELEDYLRDASGLPGVNETSHGDAKSIVGPDALAANPDIVKRIIKAEMARVIKGMRNKIS